MAPWIERPAYLARLRQLLARFPAVCLLGPRQSGKTSLARRGFADFQYLDLELPSDLQKLSLDPELFLRTRSRPLVIDEAQRFPALFPLLRAIIDRDPARRFLLLGSASFQLVTSINESLAGRVGFVELTPLLASECAKTESALERHWLTGGFPDAFTGAGADALDFEWFEHYSRAIIERDLPALGISLSPQNFRRLWGMCAHSHGSLLNMNKLAESMGISPHTVARYLDILEQSFLLRRLPSFHANLKKRLVKSPKIYLRDSGLLHYFLRILDRETLLVSPERGKSFEGYVVELVTSLARLHTPELDAHCFRTSDQYEVDLLLTGGRALVPIEVKSALSISGRDASRLEKCRKLLGAPRAYVVTLGDERFPLSSEIECVGIHHWREAGFEPFWS